MPELRLIDPWRPQEHRIRVRDVLSFAPLRNSRLVAGQLGLDSAVTGINVMQVPTDEFAKHGAVLLAGTSVFGALDDIEGLLGRLIRRRIAGLAIRGDELEQVLPAAALALADRRALPLIQLPPSVHLGQLMTDLLGMLVANQYTTLRSAGEVRAELSGYVLSGGGLDGLPDAITGIVGGEVVLFTPEGQLLASSHGAELESAEEVARAWLEHSGTEPMEAVGEGWIVWPVLAGVERLGMLVARPGAVSSSSVSAALRHGVTNVALQILQEREALAADAALRHGFFRDLLYGSVEGEAAERRAAAIGLAVEPYRVVLIQGSPLSDAEIARRLGGALVVRHGDASLAMLPDGDGGIEAVTAALPAVHSGISALHDGLDELPSAVADASEALAAARRFDREVHVRQFDELGPLRLLAHVDTDELEAFPADVLAPLHALPEGTRTTLLETLGLLLDTGLNVAETARRGGWHYNTVRYRVARLTELLGPLFSDGTLLESLSLALLLRNAMGSTPGSDPNSALASLGENRRVALSGVAAARPSRSRRPRARAG